MEGQQASTKSTSADAASSVQRTSTNPSELDSMVPKTAKDVPLEGISPSQGVSFKEQVQGHAKMFAGKAFGNDNEAQEGAARIRGLEESQQEQK